MKCPTIEQFNLFAPSSGCESSFITLEGSEWPDLLQASRSIKNHYGRQFAVEVNARHFVLTSQEMLRIKKTGIPYQLGFYHDDDVVVLSSHENNMRDHLKWLTDEERNVANDWGIVESDDHRMQPYKTGGIGPYKFQAVIYDRASQYGVRGGNITKLELRIEVTDQLVAYFNHEWVILPDDVSTHLAIEALVDYYKDSESETSTES
jgi:hypothetical protein